MIKLLRFLYLNPKQFFFPMHLIPTRILPQKRVLMPPYLCKRSITTVETVKSCEKAPQHYIGEKIHGYTLKKIEYVPELFLKTYFLIHDKTKAEHLHVERDDKNNFMAITFRTPPYDDTGLPHVLEHLVASCSKKYPCNDVFFSMIPRTLATLMNAFTSFDFTTYPFSTTNTKDFDNILNVYLDITFFSTLDEIAFKREAWRLEHDCVNDKSSPIIIKGSVFNEMKGYYSDTSQIFFKQMMKHLLPSSCYSYDYGGNPLSIPNLSLKATRNFYKTYYHPTNSRFFTYGNIPLTDHLQKIDSIVLRHFNKDSHILEKSFVKPQPFWENQQEALTFCPYDKMVPFPDKQVITNFSYLFNISDTYERFVLSFICNLLTSGQTSSFYEPLINSGLGMEFSPGTGLIDLAKHQIFSVGLKGISEDEKQKVLSIIDQTFKSVVKNGFPKKRIDALLHLIELDVKHQNKNFGLSLFNSIIQTWVHDSDPVKILKINETLEKFRKDLKLNEDFLTSRVNKYFLNNKHRLTFTMKPLENYNELETEQEKALIERKLSSMHEEDKRAIYEDGLKIHELLNKRSNVSYLPTLDASQDITREKTITNMKKIKIRNYDIFIFPQQTNELVYFKAILTCNEKDIPKELKKYLSVFANIINKVGAGNLTHKERDDEIFLRTGGLSTKIHHVPINDLNHELGIKFSSFSLRHNTENMFNLWKDLFFSLRFDEKQHIQNLIKLNASSAIESISSDGSTYALMRAARKLTSYEEIEELFKGLTSISLFKELVQGNNIDDLCEKLILLYKYLFNYGNLRIAINTEPENIDKCLSQLENFVSYIKLNSVSSTIKQPIEIFPPSKIKEYYSFPFSSNYLGRCVLTVPYSHPDYAGLLIGSKLLKNSFLIPKIRGKGQTYDAGASITRTGVYSMYTYSDSNVDQSVENFYLGIEWLEKGEYEDNFLNEAKLSAFSSIDAPLTPQAVGERIFTNGISDDEFHNFRIKLLNVSKEDIQRTCKYLKNEDSIVAIGEQCKEKQDWKIIDSSELTS